MNGDFDGYVLNNHLMQYVGDDELEANDIRQVIVDYLYQFLHLNVNGQLSGREITHQKNYEP